MNNLFNYSTFMKVQITKFVTGSTPVQIGSSLFIAQPGCNVPSVSSYCLCLTFCLMLTGAMSDNGQYNEDNVLIAM